MGISTVLSSLRVAEPKAHASISMSGTDISTKGKELMGVCRNSELLAAPAPLLYVSFIPHLPRDSVEEPCSGPSFPGLERELQRNLVQKIMLYLS